MIGIGDRVVCVDDSMQPHTVEELKRDVPNWIKKDEEYTVLEIIEYDFGVTAIILEEIRNPVLYFKAVDDFREPAFLITRFRKIEKQTATVEEEIEAVV